MNDYIVAAEQGYYMDPALAPAACGPLQHWHRDEPPSLPPDDRARGTPIRVYVNHGRWIAECPGCRGAQYASRTDRRFYCVDCLNAWNAGAWARTLWPDDASLAVIEDLLCRRHVENRHWLPSESLAALELENHLHPQALVVAAGSGAIRLPGIF